MILICVEGIDNININVYEHVSYPRDYLEEIFKEKLKIYVRKYYSGMCYRKKL